MLLPPIKNTTLFLPFVTHPPPAPLYPYHLMLIVRSLLFGHQRVGGNTVRTPSPRQHATTDAPTSPTNASIIIPFTLVGPPVRPKT